MEVRDFLGWYFSVTAMLKTEKIYGCYYLVSALLKTKNNIQKVNPRNPRNQKNLRSKKRSPDQRASSVVSNL